MSDGRGKLTYQTHCDKCKVRAYEFWESKYYFKGLVCTDCYDKLMKEARDNDGEVWYDFTKSPV